MLSQQEQTTEVLHGGLEAKAGMVLGLPQSLPLGSDTVFTLTFQHRVTQIPSPSEEGRPGGD